MESPTQRFLEYLRLEKRYSDNTVSAYERDIAKLTRFLSVPITEVRSHHIDGFVAHLHGKGLAPRSIQRALSSVRSLFNFLEQTGVVRGNPAAAVRSPHCRPRGALV